MKHFAAHHADEQVPRSLLRGLLDEALAAKSLAAGVNLQGSRVAAAWAVSGELLLASPCGRIGEDVSLSVLTEGGAGDTGFQASCRPTARCLHAAFGVLRGTCPIPQGSTSAPSHQTSLFLAAVRWQRAGGMCRHAHPPAGVQPPPGPQQRPSAAGRAHALLAVLL